MRSRFFTLILFLIGSMVYSQNTAEYIHPEMSNFKDFVNEVYQDKAQKLVFEDEVKVAEMKKILKNQVIIYKSPKPIQSSKYKSLSEVELRTDINPDLKREEVFKPKSFNPFKYKFDFKNKKMKKIYSVSGTRYLIIIDWFKK